jgi:hypothetical protein
MAETKMTTEKLPRASSITSTHMQSAFIYGSIRAARRIELFGRMNRRVLRNIGKPAEKDGTVGKI